MLRNQNNNFIKSNVLNTTLAVNTLTDYTSSFHLENYSLRLGGSSLDTSNLLPNIKSPWLKLQGIITGNSLYGTESHNISLEWADGIAKTFDPNKSTWIVIHGLQMDSPKGDILDQLKDIKNLANAVDGFSPDDQVLVLDWRSAAYSPGFNYRGNFNIPNPVIALSWVDSAAAWTADILKQFGITTPNINLIGHSFGSYVASTIAADVQGGINNIIALDPGNLEIGGDKYKQTKFSDNSHWSWSFYSSGFGDQDRARTADESFLIQFPFPTQFPDVPGVNKGHGAVEELFTAMLKKASDKQHNSLEDFFGLDRMNPIAKPWKIDYSTNWEATLIPEEIFGSWILRNIKYNP
ncbi:putative lipase superfamily [Calothrix sp. NIES-4071]|nr:putative lipase superfamily [Calothrix sp. NIES-4071]BAZ54495.1 putative lipase superfamily [Calothrix sp. NIES-4105]